jgi:hypothetical protein
MDRIVRLPLSREIHRYAGAGSGGIRRSVERAILILRDDPMIRSHEERGQSGPDVHDPAKSVVPIRRHHQHGLASRVGLGSRDFIRHLRIDLRRTNVKQRSALLIYLYRRSCQ